MGITIAEEHWRQNMKALMLSIEAEVGEHLKEGKMPSVVLGTPGSLEDIIAFCNDGQPVSWTEPVTIIIADDTIELQLLRCIDLKKGQIMVL